MEFKAKLLGGSHHGKVLILSKRVPTLVMLPKLSKKERMRFLTTDLYSAFTVKEEIYELRKACRSRPLSDGSVAIEIRYAYVKKGSDVKVETVWKLGKNPKIEALVYTGDNYIAAP